MSPEDHHKYTRYTPFVLMVLIGIIGGMFITLLSAMRLGVEQSYAADTQTLYLKPVADAYVTSGSTSSNHGTKTGLGVDGDSPIKVSYLKYDLSALAGKTITKVQFSFRVADDPGQTNHSQTISVVESSLWTETGITYSNKPAVSARLATISPKNVGQSYTYDFLVPPVQAKAGGKFSFAIVAPPTSTDYLEIRSREVSGYEPQLIITYNSPTVQATPTNQPSAPTATPTPTSIPTLTFTPTPTQNIAIPTPTTQLGGNTAIISPTAGPIVGDVNSDRQVNILDYNVLMGCYSDLFPAVSCNATDAVKADITKDGKVNQFDYNFFLRELYKAQQ